MKIVLSNYVKTSPGRLEAWLVSRRLWSSSSCSSHAHLDRRPHSRLYHRGGKQSWAASSYRPQTGARWSRTPQMLWCLLWILPVLHVRIPPHPREPPPRGLLHTCLWNNSVQKLRMLGSKYIHHSDVHISLLLLVLALLCGSNVFFILGNSGGVVNSLDFCLTMLKSLGCFYFWCVLSSQWKAVTVNLQILHCQL